jgi:hypothetical protein
LDKIQQLAEIERLLEAFATQSGLLPEGAHRVRAPEVLPEELRRALNHVIAHVWVCFSRGSRFRMFTGVAALALSELQDAPVLQVNSYGEDGTLLDVGAWTVDRDGKWRRVEEAGAPMHF